MSLHEREVELLQLQEPPILRSLEGPGERDLARESTLCVEGDAEAVLAPRCLDHIRDAELQVSDALGRVQLPSERQIELGPFADRNPAPFQRQNELWPLPAAAQPELQRRTAAQLF